MRPDDEPPESDFLSAPLSDRSTGSAAPTATTFGITFRAERRTVAHRVGTPSKDSGFAAGRPDSGQLLLNR